MSTDNPSMQKAPVADRLLTALEARVERHRALVLTPEHARLHAELIAADPCSTRWCGRTRRPATPQEHIVAAPPAGVIRREPGRWIREPAARGRAGAAARGARGNRSGPPTSRPRACPPERRHCRRW